ncbi:MAG: lamin tail domain-containing protein, partial [bacterium]|nr:lamin tail domain-containing protein [bacterium]
AIVEDVIIAESARWGDSKVSNPRDKEDWDAAVASLTSTINGRTSTFLGHLRTANLYPELDAPIFSQHGGQIAGGTTINVTAPADATHIYYFFGSGDSDPEDWGDDLDPRELGGAVKSGAGSIIISVAGSYLLPVPINNPGWMQARSYNSSTSEWSAMTTAFFTTAPAAGGSSIVISEVHYHPTNPTTAELLIDPTFDQDDFEFIEVMNISGVTVDLGGAAFVLTPIGDHLEGVEVVFPSGTLIGPGERLLIVANTAAFNARYPGVSASKIVGDYSGRLNNTGEWITLQAADGTIIDSFRYNDLAPWPVNADGLGPSLALVDPGSDPAPSLAASWMNSIDDGGSPGEQEGTPFAGNANDDLDADGGVALLEYFVGSSDTVPSLEHLMTLGIETIGIDQYASITYRSDPHAVDATGTIQISTDLDIWSSDLADIVFVRSGTDTDGTPTLTYRSAFTLDAESSLFFRLRVEIP